MTHHTTNHLWLTSCLNKTKKVILKSKQAIASAMKPASPTLQLSCGHAFTRRQLKEQGAITYPLVIEDPGFRNVTIEDRSVEHLHCLACNRISTRMYKTYY